MFSQASFDLPWAVKFDPHAPRINLDSMKVTATQAFAAALKEHLTEIFKEPVEARLLKLKPGECSGIFYYNILHVEMCYASITKLKMSSFPAELKTSIVENLVLGEYWK